MCKQENTGRDHAGRPEPGCCPYGTNMPGPVIVVLGVHPPTVDSAAGVVGAVMNDCRALDISVVLCLIITGRCSKAERGMSTGLDGEEVIGE
jgi:hypothetical protein